MSRTPATFKQADLARAIRAARASGLDVTRTEIRPDGGIVLVHVPINVEPERSSAAAPNEWDDYLNAQGQK